MSDAAEPTPAVGVVIPTRNRFDFTAEAISSVQAQTYPNWQLYVVDDASDDGSLPRLRRLVASDQRVHLIALPQRLGQSGARQTGFEACSEPLVALLDSDDVWLPDKLSVQVTRLTAASTADPGVGVVRCRTQWVSAEGTPVRRRWRPFRAARRRASLPASFANVSAVLLTRQTIEKMGGVASPDAERLTNAVHIEFELRQRQVSDAEMVDRVLVMCRNHPAGRSSDSLGTRAAADGLATALELHDRFLRQCPHLAARLNARVGARYLDAGDPVGYRYLVRALRAAGARDGISLALRYAPFAGRKLPRALRQVGRGRR